MAQAPPLVSVVIACRNEARWIGETLRCVLGQTHAALDVVVVDDGSTDSTPGIVASFGDPRLRLIRGSATGACAARNAGLRAARGGLIQMLDGDDLMAADKIERQVERWRRDGDRHVYFGPYASFAHDPDQAIQEPKPNWADMSGHAWLVSCWRHGGMMAPHSWLTPRALVDAAGPWNEKLLQNQDGEWFSRVLLASDGVRYCPDALSHYRIGVKPSISRRDDHAARLSRYDATRLMATRLLTAPEADAETRAACAAAFEELMFVTWVRYPDLAARARKHLRACGGADLRMPYRGELFRRTRRLVGWRLACRIQHLFSVLQAWLADDAPPVPDTHAKILAPNFRNDDS